MPGSKLGPAPEGTTPDAVLRTLQTFAGAFAKATTENARAKVGGAPLTSLLCSPHRLQTVRPSLVEVVVNSMT